jgi:hypothetical protein
VIPVLEIISATILVSALNIAIVLWCLACIARAFEDENPPVPTKIKTNVTGSLISGGPSGPTQRRQPFRACWSPYDRGGRCDNALS